MVGVELDDPAPIKDQMAKPLVIASTINVRIEESDDELFPSDIPLRDNMDFIVDIPSDEEEEEKKLADFGGDSILDRSEIRECKEGDTTFVVEAEYQADIKRLIVLINILRRIDIKLILIIHGMVGDGKTSLLRILMSVLGIKVYAEPIHLYQPYLTKIRETTDSALNN